eukprot:6684198-Pyramimonas_sp.AAC.1
MGTDGNRWEPMGTEIDDANDASQEAALVADLLVHCKRTLGLHLKARVIVITFYSAQVPLASPPLLTHCTVSMCQHLLPIARGCL